MADVPPAKRQRREETPAIPIVRSKIWYDDGSVVLQAESTQCRVHWSVLVQHSTVFADMRQIPQPPDEPTVEGCPIIQLSDTIQDLEHLLSALYDPLCCSALTVEFTLAAAIIRLGKKYDFPQLVKAMVDRLTSLYPTTLCAYRNTFLHNEYAPRFDCPTLLMDAINLANENGLLALLPALYLDLLSEQDDEMDVLLKGIARPDGTTAKLSFESQVLCIRSQAAVAHAQSKHMWSWLSPSYPSTAFCSLPRCKKLRERLISSFFFPRYAITGMETLDPSLGKFCPECTVVASALHEQGCQKFWDLLPTLFGLPPWADLKNDI